MLKCPDPDRRAIVPILHVDCVACVGINDGRDSIAGCSPYPPTITIQRLMQSVPYAPPCTRVGIGQKKRRHAVEPRNCFLRGHLPSFTLVKRPAMALSHPPCRGRETTVVG